MSFSSVYSAVALSAVSGQVLWRKVMRESVMYIQCGLQYSAQPSPVVLLIGKSVIIAVNGSSGRTWSMDRVYTAFLLLHRLSLSTCYSGCYVHMHKEKSQ